MSAIAIEDLNYLDIFLDGESYLGDLTETELNLRGGLVYSPYLEQQLSLRPTALTLCI
uniref:Uncharacterized protein n=1 Tax=Synechocystis sp. PCC 9413 TaxID=77760 RepID=A0A2P0ZGK6_9SYNC|nr:hypothetical protein [Synechocystis sp. PCC 9413]